ncbi:MAG: glycoside hydrolase [Spirochaetaceae bacterium]|jgi:spore germination protein YaaH|nr:glycoside hydrolase [Spirochaetaceae bacterium]
MRYNPVVIVLLLCWTACKKQPEPPIADSSEPIAVEIEEEVAMVLAPLDAQLPVVSWGEVWAYIVDGREPTVRQDIPISDLAYFGATVDTYGTLVGAPDRNKLSWFQGRVHIVVTCESRALTHFALEEGSATRKQLISDLLMATEPFDGLQIDFEQVPARDRQAFRSFLRELQAGIGDKMLSVALPARLRSINDDVYDYRSIAGIVDRVLVMAYDEHWSGSEPGPIASLVWCKRIADYAFSTIGHEKLIMGLPFYGRAWGFNPNNAYIYSRIEQLKSENGVSAIEYKNGIPTFSYSVPVTVTVYYEDAYSLINRLQIYKEQNINAVGFWRLGQEDPRFWTLIRLEE